MRPTAKAGTIAGRLPAWLVLVCFVGDDEVGGPSIEAEWKGALKLLDGQRSPGPRPLGDFVDRIRQTIDLCAKENSRCAE